MSMATDLPRGVFVVAQATVLPAIDAISGQVTTVECAIDDPLPLAQVASASLIVIEVDPTSRNSLERIDRLRNEMPSVPVIAGLAKVDIATSRQLLRRGVSDIVALPFSIDELVTSIADTASQIDVRTEAILAPLVSILKTTGGSGATTIATHLAAQLAKDMGTKCHACVIDLDLQSGDVASYLGSTPRLSLSDLLEAEGRLDDELVRSVACEGRAQVDIIAAPSEIVPIESVDFDALARVLAIARRQYDVVVLDLPATLTNWSLSTIFGSDLTLLIGTLSIPSLRHAKRQLDFLVSMGIPRPSIQIVMNRVETGLFKTIGTGAASDALHHPILATISEEPKLLRSAQDQGELVNDIQARSKFAKDIENLADLVAGLLPEAS